MIDKNNRPIYTLDIETDPFEYGKSPNAFCVGIYDGASFWHTWGDACVERTVEYLTTLPAGVIYIHNGGRFDVFYLMRYLVGRMMIINSRVVRCQIRAEKGNHEIRDSYAIMPFKLEKYKKDEIDYAHLRAECRHLYRDEIINYLRGDCVYLHEMCCEFVKTFGRNKLTIGSTALAALKQTTQFFNLTADQDADIRSNFYYGGRVQCFKKGIIELPLTIYDVNSMYPFVMRNFKHPLCKPTAETKRITSKTFFLEVEGRNYGGFPARTKTGITFGNEYGTYTVSIHEFQAAVTFGLFSTHKVRRCINFEYSDSFQKFVDHFYHLRKQAKDSGDGLHALFFKYVLNSSYGKFAQNPANFYDYKIGSGEGWEDEYTCENWIISKRESKLKWYNNVATAASITGAARAVLMEGIARSHNCVYCDTDSIICSQLDGVRIDDSELGAWKIEGKGDSAAIAGKKMYAVFQNNECVKMASKGVRLTSDEIVKVCSGEIVESKKESPCFGLNGKTHFTHRAVRIT